MHLRGVGHVRRVGKAVRVELVVISMLYGIASGCVAQTFDNDSATYLPINTSASDDCLDDGQSCTVDSQCCGLCHHLDAVCYTPDWLSCDEPQHAVVPAGVIDSTPAGKLQWLQTNGYQGDIYDAHLHIYATGEPMGRMTPTGQFVVYRPVTIEEAFSLHDFFVSEHLNIVGGANLILADFGGLGDPTSQYEFQGQTLTPSYRPFEAGTSIDDDNTAAFSGANVNNAYTLYTKLASYVKEENRYRYFAFPSLDWHKIRYGILEGTFTSIEHVKKALASQIRWARDFGYDGIKFKSEWFPSSRTSAMRSLVLLETLPDAGDEPWEIDGEMFNGPGGILDTAARLGIPLLFHAGDSGARAEEFWGPDGILATVLDAHPGLKLQIAHGFVLANAHASDEHASNATVCDQRVKWVFDLFDRFDGRAGRSMLRIDLVWRFLEWWREHNELYQQGEPVEYDYRDLLIRYSRHLMLGLDPVLKEVEDYQSDGCGSNGRLEQNYVTMRSKLEGPYRPNDPSTRFLDLVDAGSTLDSIYRNNLLEEVAVDPSKAEQIGSAGVDSNNVRHVNCDRVIDYVRGLGSAINTNWRGTTPATDPLVRSMQDTLEALQARCSER